MSEICEHCGGRRDRNTCVCDLALSLRKQIKEALGLDDDALDRALDNGEIYLTRYSGCGEDGSLTVQEIQLVMKKMED